MTETSFDLVDIIRTLQKKRVFILSMTLAAMLLGGVYLAIRHTKYKGVATFFVNNPLYGDRSTLFRSQDTRYVDYFGGDDDVDKIMAFANSDTVRERIIRNCQFQDVYKKDINDPKGHAALMGIFSTNFGIKRSEYKDVTVSYIAYDPVVAANVANMTVKVMEETYRHYYTAMKMNMYSSISEKVVQLDSSINALTDTLAGLRDKYGIYSLISPDRRNIINGDGRAGGKGYGRAIEEIQNIESIKDQLVIDRAHYISTLNEFAATTNRSMEFLKMITRALPPTRPTGASITMVLLVAACLGLAFSTIYALLITYFRKLNSVVR
jgi:capsular polysaccharide biosynthesis protein